MKSGRRLLSGGLIAAIYFSLSSAWAGRPDCPEKDDLFRFADGETIELYDSSHFRLHFTKQGKDAVVTGDKNSNQVPDVVKEVSRVYEDAWLFYHNQLGYRVPVSDVSSAVCQNDARFDVYLIDFAGFSDGAFRKEACADGAETCGGYIIQENDFAGYNYPSATVGHRTVGSHEYFHAIQAAYDIREGSVFNEGTAVWASNQFDTSLYEVAGYSKGYFDRPDRTLDQALPSAADPFSYGTAIFFQFLGERHSPQIIRELWEASVGGDTEPSWFAALDPLLKNGYGSSFADEFSEFSRWNLYTGSRAISDQFYAQAALYPQVRIDAQKLPYSEKALRLFPASTLYLSANVRGKDKIAIALVSSSALPTLRLLATTRRLSKVAEVAWLPELSYNEIETNGADEAIFGLVYTAQVGQSLRPAICVGSLSDVAACRASYLPPPDPPPPTSGGCSVATASPTQAGWVLLLLVFGLLAKCRKSLGDC